MTPKQLLQYSLSMLLCASITQRIQAQKASDSKPNVVVMLADNMGFGDLGCYASGGELRGMPTPRIDKLAGEGMRLTQFLWSQVAPLHVQA